MANSITINDDWKIEDIRFATLFYIVQYRLHGKFTKLLSANLLPTKLMSYQTFIIYHARTL